MLFILEFFSFAKKIILIFFASEELFCSREYSCEAPPKAGRSRIVCCWLSILMGVGNAAEEILDVKSPVDWPVNFLPLIFLFLALFIGLCLWLVRCWLRQRLKKKTSVLSPVLPWDAAHARLEKLHALNLPAQGRIKEYYIELSDIVRRYIEDRFSIHAPEMTTEEFLYSLQSSNSLSSAQKVFLKEFLNECDMVKFAKYLSNDKMMEQSYQVTKRLIDETKGDQAINPSPLSEGGRVRGGQQK